MKSLSMDISVKFSKDEFELSLGACKAKLSTSELLLLRKNLVATLSKVWQQPSGFWEEQQAKLNELKYIALSLAQLDENTLEAIVISNPDCNWLPLLNFANLELPKLAASLQSIIGKKTNQETNFFFASSEESLDQLHLEPATSIMSVIETLTQLEEKLGNNNPEIASILAEQKAINTKVQPIGNDKVFSFLDYLGSLPASNLKLILKKISREELGLLFSTCKMLKAVKLLEQLKIIFPEKIFQQFEKNCPARVEEHQVRSLLNKLNRELKELQTLLKNRKQP